ncbi:hypothetical protein HCU66_24900 [Pseudomonas frederiksbergensis]|uniref:hypothetical protein n=1 Tax=Pseudomonas frederiksbergensis TaxID=104087 RepID=UPI00197FFB20|nr:hypothetical protein [Pseudomonas frederiksbergensis]MBN3865446.1 hypothetical protein [Pseudomonas frederiksbergensis]
MNMITQRFRQAVNAGTCIGKINTTEPFNAGLVELSERSFPPPHGEAYFMFARQRDSVDYTTKELTLSFSKGLANDTYDLTPHSHDIRLTFADNSDPTKPVIYTQREGTAELKYDDSTGVFSGALKGVIVENRDDDVDKELTIEVDFSAKGSIAMSRRARTLAA